MRSFIFAAAICAYQETLNVLSFRETDALVLRAEQPEAGSSPLAFDTQFPQPLWRQYFIILVKNLVRT